MKIKIKVIILYNYLSNTFKDFIYCNNKDLKKN